MGCACVNRKLGPIRSGNIESFQELFQAWRYATSPKDSRSKGDCFCCTRDVGGAVDDDDDVDKTKE